MYLQLELGNAQYGNDSFWEIEHNDNMIDITLIKAQDVCLRVQERCQSHWRDKIALSVGAICKWLGSKQFPIWTESETYRKMKCQRKKTKNSFASIARDGAVSAFCCQLPAFFGRLNTNSMVLPVNNTLDNRCRCECRLTKCFRSNKLGVAAIWTHLWRATRRTNANWLNFRRKER